MSIVSYNVLTPGLVGVTPRRVQIVATDNLATVTTAGYLNRQGQVLEGLVLQPTDVIDMLYSFNTATNVGTYEVFLPTFSNGVITLNLWANAGDVLLPVTSGDFAVFNGTTGQIKDAGYLPSNAAKTNVVMANGATIANHIGTFTDTAGTLGEDAATAINGGNIQAGLSGTAGTFTSFPATAANGSFIFKAINNSGGFNSTLSNANIGQSTVYSLPDPGAATANILLDTGTNTSGTFTTITATTANITNLKYGATPVAQVDPASCTITAAAGAANTSTITVQLKDGSGTNMTRSTLFRVYSSSAADGLTLQSAASTGYSVASGGLSLQNGAAITTQITAMSSATGGCVLSLLDTGKQTSYLVLVLPTGNKISAQLSAGSYG